MHPSQTLERLLAELFTSAELRRWLRYRNKESERLVDTLPTEPVEPAELAHQASRALVRFGLVDRAFWDDLVRERPGQASRVRAAQVEWRAEQVARWPRLALAAVATALVVIALWSLSRAPMSLPTQDAERTEPTVAEHIPPPAAPVETFTPTASPTLAPSAPKPPPPVAEPRPSGASPPTVQTTEVTNSELSAERDAKIKGDQVGVEGSTVSAGRDIEIGGESL